MIPLSYITEWRENAPWIEDYQVEQDLIICRAICEIFSEEFGRKNLAFRGGTALQKLFFKTQNRYSEDIDLVQINKGKAGIFIDYFRDRFQSWLGKPTIDLKNGRITLRYKYQSENDANRSMKLKIEINNSEAFTVLGYKTVPFKIKNSWYSNETKVTTFAIEELMGTKLRALYQRKKGRDLFDFEKVFTEFPQLKAKDVIRCFYEYLSKEGLKISRAEFEKNLHEKMQSAAFKADINSLISNQDGVFDIHAAFKRINQKLIDKLPGEPWQRPKS